MSAISEITKEFRNHARALLFAYGYDPNPANVSKLVLEDNTENAPVIGLEKDSYKVLVKDKFNSFISTLILQNPLAIPSKYLALFISKAFSKNVEMQSIIQVAENFRQNPTFDSSYHLGKLFEHNLFIFEHLEEVLIQEFKNYPDLTDFVKDLGFKDFKRVDYKGIEYFIIKL